MALEADVLGEPNGIFYDAERRRFLLGPIAGAKSVLAWGGPGTEAVPIATGPGRYDGIEVLPGGRTLVSVWNDSTVSEIVGGRLRPVAVPRLREDRVEFWRLTRVSP